MWMFSIIYLFLLLANIYICFFFSKSASSSGSLCNIGLFKKINVLWLTIVYKEYNQKQTDGSEIRKPTFILILLYTKYFFCDYIIE